MLTDPVLTFLFQKEGLGNSAGPYCQRLPRELWAEGVCTLVEIVHRETQRQSPQRSQF